MQHGPRLLDNRCGGPWTTVSRAEREWSRLHAHLDETAISAAGLLLRNERFRGEQPRVVTVA
jgi:hypothetical protein